MKIKKISKICMVVFMFITINDMMIKKSYSEEEITSAFGLKLGDVFEPSQAIGTSSLTDGTPMYRFLPTKKFRSFEDYYVMITPKTHRICSIWGIGPVENTGKCEKEQAVIIELLAKKYGQPEGEGFFDSIYGAKRIDHGNRDITVKCSGFVDSSIEIRYTDRELKELAENERIEKESENIDDSAL